MLSTPNSKAEIEEIEAIKNQINRLFQVAWYATDHRSQMEALEELKEYVEVIVENGSIKAILHDLKLFKCTIDKCIEEKIAIDKCIKGKKAIDKCIKGKKAIDKCIKGKKAMDELKNEVEDEISSLDIEISVLRQYIEADAIFGELQRLLEIGVFSEKLAQIVRNILKEERNAVEAYEAMLKQYWFKD